jgi:hypothetical protein
MRVVVNCFDLKEKSSGLGEETEDRSHGGGKVRKMKLEYPRFWEELLELLRSDLDWVSTIVA